MAQAHRTSSYGASQKAACGFREMLRLSLAEGFMKAYEAYDFVYLSVDVRGPILFAASLSELHTVHQE